MWGRLPLIAALAACVGCASGTRQPGDSQGPTVERQVYLSPTGFAADLITPDGIHVRTNGQYKTAAARESASATIDRYWREVRECALQNIPATDNHSAPLFEEFPQHLSIEIAQNWEIVEGPVSHTRMQAFPSSVRPGAFSTARREESAVYIEVVPELKGLATQMAGELNLWIGGYTSAAAGDLSAKCASLPCFRFDYDNSPSQAWQECVD